MFAQHTYTKLIRRRMDEVYIFVYTKIGLLNHSIFGEDENLNGNLSVQKSPVFFVG